MILFTVRIDAEGTRLMDTPYASFVECLEDDALEALFDSGHIDACWIYCGTERMAGVPVLKWSRFTEALIGNATSILRRSFPKAMR